MTTTTAAYLSVMNNLSNMQKATAADPAVKTATAYYAANIGKVASIDDFVGNYRLLSYALDAYGLGDQINNTALIKQVLQGGVASSSSLANTLPKWTAFATAFNFAADGAAAATSSTSISTTESNYVEEQLESDQGQTNVGVQLAMYFQRVAPTVTSAYGILADSNLLEAVETIFGLPSSFSAEDIDVQAKTLTNLFDISDLKDPTKLTQLTERFTAQYDSIYNNPTSTATPLTVSGSSSSSSSSAYSPAAGALSVLSGIVSSNASYNASSTTVFSQSLLQSLQGFTLGG